MRCTVMRGLLRHCYALHSYVGTIKMLLCAAQLCGDYYGVAMRCTVMWGLLRRCYALHSYVGTIKMLLCAAQLCGDY